jgi:nicotinate-nucleotide pyrophosphorylase (carboxylating)
MNKPTQAECDNLNTLLALAKAEDLGAGDVTSNLLPESTRAVARFVTREEVVLCGGAFLETIASAYGPIETEVFEAEGTLLPAGKAFAQWTGPARSVLPAERVALNFLQRLTGIATITRQYVRAAEGTAATVVDTRKTTPGYRLLEKYAVRVGGGGNHRMGLYDAVLVKDNHLAALQRAGSSDPIGDLVGPLAAVRPALPPEGFVELEVDTLVQLASALALPVDIILLDNMTPAQLRQAVAMRDQAGQAGRILLEASGGITLESVAQVARTGVDRISVGALTHSARAVDIGLDTTIDQGLAQ